MSAAGRDSDIPDSDAYDGAPHPRFAQRLYGHLPAETEMLNAYRTGRLAHAWLIGGAPGVGKATLAWRFARFLLSHPDPNSRAVSQARDLAVEDSHPAARLLAGHAHPDFALLRREWDAKTKKHFTLIRVDDVREKLGVFQLSAAYGGWRVAIVDAADDLNVASANALLKVIEEPPPRSLILIIAHRPGQVLPTIRSRCRRLVFAPPPQAEASLWLQRQADVSEETALSLLRLARGAPGLALRLAGAGALEIDEAARKLVARLPVVDESAALSLADGFRGAEGQARFALLMDRIGAALHERAAAAALDGRGALDRWAEAWELVSNLPGEAEAINLDRADAFFSALTRLKALA